MTFRQTLLAAALPFLLVAPTALAQDAPPQRSEQRGQRPDGQRGPDRMFEGLNLSDAQKTQLREAMQQQRERFRPQMEALRNQTGLTDEQKRERREALMTQQRSEMDAAARRILTPEQYQSWTQQRQQMEQRRGQRPGMEGRMGQARGQRNGQNARPGMNGRMGDRAANALNLSDAQKTRMQAIGERQRTAMQALRNEALTVEQRRTRTQALMTQFRQEREAVLTPEQRQRAEQLRQQGRERGPQRRGQRTNDNGQ